MREGSTTARHVGEKKAAWFAIYHVAVRLHGQYAKRTRRVRSRVIARNDLSIVRLTLTLLNYYYRYGIDRGANNRNRGSIFPPLALHDLVQAISEIQRRPITISGFICRHSHVIRSFPGPRWPLA